jgi:hypothetical protein
VFVCALVCVVLFLLIRSNVFGMRLPDFSRFMFSLPKVISDCEEENVTSKMKDVETLKEMILKDAYNDFSFGIRVCSLTAVTESDNVCRSLMYVYEHNGDGLNFIKKLIEYEVSNATTTTTLFRNNSIATKCFKVYSRMVGLPYLYRVLHPLMDKLIREEQRTEAGVRLEGDVDRFDGHSFDLSDSYELNPVRFEENPTDDEMSTLETNSYAIQLTCSFFLSSLNRTSRFCPHEFRKLCLCVHKHVHKKFPDHKVELALSAFMFLRYFVAGLSVPESFGLVSEPPSDSLRRKLILISKVISNLSTQVKFGVKEEYMTIMNDFLEDNKDSLNAYYAFLCKVFLLFSFHFLCFVFSSA